MSGKAPQLLLKNILTYFVLFCNKTKHFLIRRFLLQETASKKEYSIAELTRKGETRLIKLNYRISDAELTVFLKDEIDQNSAGPIRECIDCLVGRNRSVRKLIFDLSKVTFMDSSGIGVILGRYKLMAARGGTIGIANPNESIVKILRIAGIYKLTNKVS